MSEVSTLRCTACSRAAGRDVFHPVEAFAPRHDRGRGRRHSCREAERGGVSVPVAPEALPLARVTPPASAYEAMVRAWLLRRAVESVCP